MVERGGTDAGVPAGPAHAADVVSLGRVALGRLGARVGWLYLGSAALALLAGAWTGHASATGERAGVAAVPAAAGLVGCGVVLGLATRPGAAAALRPAAVLLLAAATAAVTQVAVAADWRATTFVSSVAATAGATGLAIGAGSVWGVLSCAASLASLAGVLARHGLTLDAGSWVGTVISTAVAVATVELFGRGFAATERELSGADEALLERRVTAERWRARRRTDRRLHDTVLSTLSLLAHADFRTEPEVLRELCRRDLRELSGELADPAETPPDGAPPVGGPALDDVARWRAAGPALNLHGQPWPAVAAELPPGTARALADAVTECVANARRHAGVAVADVVVIREPAAVSVLVVDAGAGFDPAAVAADRLGLVESVHARLAEVGGAAEVWSRPGEGTTAFLSVPRAAAGGGAP